MEADFWFEPALVLEVLGAEITISPIHTAAYGKITEGRRSGHPVPPVHRHVPRRQGAEGGHHQRGAGGDVRPPAEEGGRVGRSKPYEKVYKPR